MQNKKRSYKKLLMISSLIIIGVIGAGYISLEYLKSQLESKITGCKLDSINFNTVIDFEYVNNWIVVYAKVGDSDKEFPFIFDTGAQTVILDSLKSEIGQSSYESQSFSNGSRNEKTAFNNELISINNLSLGDVSFSDIGSMSAINSKWGMLNCISPYGIIGYNVIQTCCYQIDYKKEQITMTDNVESLNNYNDIQWVSYTPSKYQESPIIEAILNDSIKLKLFFDTGMRGGIVLSSNKLYDSFTNSYTDSLIHCEFKPSISIRGERDNIANSLIFNASDLSIGDIQSKDIAISIKDIEEREFSGIIGNVFFDDFIITLDYNNSRIGFTPNHLNKESTFNSFGINYTPKKNALVVSSVYKGYKPHISGITPGDTVFSINGIIILNLNEEELCDIYRNEFSLESPTDSNLKIQIIRNNSLISYNFDKQIIF